METSLSPRAACSLNHIPNWACSLLVTRQTLICTPMKEHSDMTAGGGAQTILCSAAPTPITRDVSVHQWPICTSPEEHCGTMAGGEAEWRTQRKGFIYICTVCVCSCWEYICSLATRWTWGHGTAAALHRIGCQIQQNIFFPLQVWQYICIFLLVNAISEQKKNIRKCF